MTRWLGLSAVVLVALGACGGEVDDAPRPASAQAAAESCYGLCEKQASDACAPQGERTLAACQKSCDAIVSSLKPECRSPFTEFYTCASRRGGCSGSAVDQQCLGALDRLGACEGCRKVGDRRQCD